MEIETSSNIEGNALEQVDNVLDVQEAGPRRKSRRRRLVHGVSWVVAIPVAIFLVAYLVLLVRPIPLPFVGAQARALVLASMPENMELQLGETFLTLEDGVAPAIRFSPVVLQDRSTGGKVEMEALEVGFSALRAVLGQPGAEITLVAPRLQVVQDLFGPRLAQFELLDDPNGGYATVQVIEGDNSFPVVGIKGQGLEFEGEILGSPALSLRSDNDWLIYNLEAGEEGLRSVIENSDAGLFSKFAIRNGSLEMHDSVYGLVRTFSEIELEITTRSGTSEVHGEISALIAGKRMTGTIARTVEPDGSVRLVNKIENLDFAAFVPFMDDPDGDMALHGTGSILADVGFAKSEGIEVDGGTFLIDLNGMSLRIQDDDYPVTASPLEIEWSAPSSTFNMKSTRFQAGQSHVDFSGVVVMGLDENFGPTMRLSTNLKNIYLHPLDMEAPEKPIDELQFLGWSAPLYGALGIEHLAASRGDFKLVGSGRLDMLQSGMGVNMNIAIGGATADDLKRIWPYFMGGETRDWFVENIAEGKIVTSAMQFRFPIGSIGRTAKDVPMPEGAMNVEMLAEGVTFSISEDFDPVHVAGMTHLKVTDLETRIGFGEAKLPTDGGMLALSDSTFSIRWNNDDTSVFSLDGDVNAPISALLAIQDITAPEALEGVDLPLELSQLSGDITSSLSARIALKGDDYEVQDMQYLLDGTVKDFASAEPVSTYTISEGQFAFRVDPQAYRLSGPVKLNGLNTELLLQGKLEEESAPELEVSAVFDAEDFKEFGFDVSDFIGGRVKFTGKPLADGSLKVIVDLADASMQVADIGLSKSRGSSGTLEALVSFEDPLVNISDIELRFGSVRLNGEMQYHQENGLQSADFSRFAIHEGDNAQVRLSPIAGGYAVRLRGEQLDLKPLMRRFFSLESGGTGGPQTAGLTETIVLDVAIERALGFFSTTAFNLNADLKLAGEELKQVALQAQFGGANSLSVTTNPAPGGQVMSVAFGDLGTLLRFVGIYPRLAGGAGSLVMTTNTAQKVDIGNFTLRDFALIDEANVVQVVGNHPDSRAQIARQNRMDFNSGQAKFVRYSDRIEISEAVLDGGTQGGTARGFIYTDAGQYDIVGTYIPLFGLNNAFQQIPILGPLLGGRDGEGLFGVTFAIRGDLADPDFSVNPLSLLVPGAFRSLFEFRAQEQ